MRRPSRVLQHGAYNTSTRIRFAQPLHIDTRPPSSRQSLALTCTYSTTRTLCARYPCQIHHICYNGQKHALLRCSNHKSATLGARQVSTQAASPKRGAAKTNSTTLSITEDLEEAELDASDGDAVDWNNVVVHMGRTHGTQGVCAVLDRLRERDSLDVVMESDRLRNELLHAAVFSEAERQKLFECAEHLLRRFGYRWPNLYTKCMHNLLEKGALREATQTNSFLAPNFLPERHILGMFFENFVLNPDIHMQETLRTIYLGLPEHHLYDIIIPALFKSGQSNLAKSWREACLLCNDAPSSESSAAFLTFLGTYYSNTNFTSEELHVVTANVSKRKEQRGESEIVANDISTSSQVAKDIGFDAATLSRGNIDGTGNPVEPPSETNSLVNGIVEKLFASNWTPVEFAMRMAKTAGIQSIGSRALQAVALRASSAKEVNELIKSLQKLNIAIPRGAYCTAIAEFASQGHDDLLSDLLRSDIHPEEFDDQETRQMILDDAIRRHDSKQELLMRGVTKAINAHSHNSSQSAFQQAMGAPAFPLEKLVFDEPWRMKLALERIDSLGHRIGPAEASAVLQRAFAAFPVDKTGVAWASEGCIGILDEVIGLVRCMASQNAAISAQHWKMLLLGLGHQGRFDTMAQLSQEIVNVYDPSFGGWFPVHKADLPKITEVGKTLLEYTEHSSYIPADLSFYHHHHPLSKIFDGRFQRLTVQLGFNWALRLGNGSKRKPSFQNALVTKFNVACGIHILANLRDQGVFINIDVVESAARNGIYGSHRTRQRDGDKRGRHWLSSMQMKEVMDVAWGSTLMPAGYIMQLDKKDLRGLPAPPGDLAHLLEDNRRRA